jgi:hypothetical protein
MRENDRLGRAMEVPNMIFVHSQNVIVRVLSANYRSAAS